LLALNWALRTRERYAVVLALHRREIALRGVRTERIPLEPFSELAKNFERLRPDLVVHTAGMTSVEECESHPREAQHSNVDLAVNVARACQLVGARLVHISTDHLFRGDSAMSDETQPVNPLNVYARTKAEAEQRVLACCPAAIVVRTNFYGWGPVYRQSFSDVIITALRQGNSLTLFRDVFYTPILIEPLVDAVHALADNKASGVFHVSGGERISKHQFGLKVCRQFKMNPNLISSGERFGQKNLTLRPQDMSLSNKKACRFLGRTLGGVEEHLGRLAEQENQGLAKEIQSC
jgi:dTDP-4-dehydrorhamnose reductase